MQLNKIWKGQKMKKNNNIKLKKKIVLIVLILLVIVLLTMIVLKNKIRTPRENFQYIYSDEMDEGTFSPKMIHMVIAAYDGEINPKAITKSTYYIITQKIPEYVMNCRDDDSLERYFKKNRESIYLETGIKDKENFKCFITELRKLSGNLEYEYAIFDRETIKVNKNSLDVLLKVKYKNNDEISFNVQIENKESINNPSIKFYK